MAGMTPAVTRHRDLTLDLARVVCALVVVFVHLLLVGVGRNPDGSPFIINPVSGERWFALATWIAEIMPMFFVVGGFAAKAEVNPTNPGRRARPPAPPR